MSSYTAGTFSANDFICLLSKDVILIDAKNLILGRLAVEVSKIIRGKHKPIYTPHMNCGDLVIIINADQIKLTGKNKAKNKKYYRHTGYPGGLKETDAAKILAGPHPERVLYQAILRMMPKESPLARKQMSQNLKIYSGLNHPHEGLQPRLLDISAMNSKNTIIN